jgi:hypothetical protein
MAVFRSPTTDLSCCALALLAAAMVIPAAADDPPVEAPASEAVEMTGESVEVPAPDPDEEPGVVMQSIYEGQEAVSRTVITMSRRMDRMFGTTEIFPDEEYDSLLRLRLIQRIDEGGGGELEFTAGGKLSLPGTERRLSLVLLTDDYDDPLDRERGTDRELEETTRRSLALRLLRPSEIWKTAVSVGLRSGDPVDLLTRFSIWRDFQPGDLHVRPGQSIFWYDERGVGTATNLRVQHPLGTSMLLRSDSGATWFKREDQFYYDQIFSLLQPLGRRRDLLWQIGAQGESEPNKHVTRYYAQVRLRSVVHRDWLIVELRPQALHERENEFRTQLRLYVGFELLFGDPRSF